MRTRPSTSKSATMPDVPPPGATVTSAPSERPLRSGGSSSGPALEVEHLRKVFGAPRSRAVGRLRENGGFVAVDDVSFTVPQGRSLAIVGESGSGKTTVARMVVGLERPSAGRIAVGGRERSWGRVSSRERRRRGREVQIVFQDPYSSLDPRQTVGRCIEEALLLHFDLDKAQRIDRVHALFDQVGLDRRQADLLPRRLSGGQRQRVAIARALACEPRVVICDEAVASLDVSIQAQVLNLMGDIRHATGVSFLFISHDLAVVRQVSDEIVVMRRGRIVESGPADRVLDAPRHPYTRRLLAAIPRPGWHPAPSSEESDTAS